MYICVMVDLRTLNDEHKQDAAYKNVPESSIYCHNQLIDYIIFYENFM
jgi:hypothetical protein